MADLPSACAFRLDRRLACSIVNRAHNITRCRTVRSATFGIAVAFDRETEAELHCTLCDATPRVVLGAIGASSVWPYWISQPTRRSAARVVLPSSDYVRQPMHFATSPDCDGYAAGSGWSTRLDENKERRGIKRPRRSYLSRRLSARNRLPAFLESP